MGIADDIRREVRDIIESTFSERDGTRVPEAEHVRLGNDAVKIDGAVLYADLAESTAMVNGFQPWFAAKVYKSFLLSACRLIRTGGGTITAFDGDRVMAVFIGDGKESAAAKASLRINWAKIMINEEIKRKYPDVNYTLKHRVGIDTSPLFIARTGIRGSNDLVWVGRAANYAAKLSSLDKGFSSLITRDVFNALDDAARYTNGQNMWTQTVWDQYSLTVFGSSWQWPPPG